ncbi:MAG: HAD family phosphatase [Erysipelotrichaceae bacterium]|nr:HAD family phosphatase [Erysipelotrichaceae bacterium]
MIKGLLFDLDGVLIDSEAWHQRLNERCLKDLGCDDIDPKDFYALIGSGKGFDAWEKIYEGIPAKYKASNFKETFRSYKMKQFDYPPFEEIIFPDVKTALQDLKNQGYRLSCCSSSSQVYIEKALNDCEIADCFELIITGHDFSQSKPNPEIYLTAMNKLGLEKDECLVIEDSPYGLEAGKNAGMVTVARRDDHFGIDQSKADFIIPSLSDLSDLIKKIDHRYQ